MFVNTVVTQLKHTDAGCHIEGIFYGCFLYADDIIILSPSVADLQTMLDVCSKTSTMLFLNFNKMKSFCISRIVLGTFLIHSYIHSFKSGSNSRQNQWFDTSLPYSHRFISQVFTCPAIGI